MPSLALLAAGGQRLAAVSRGILSVYDLAAGATVGSARVGEKCGRPAGFFLDSQRLRLFCPSASSRSPGAVRLEILEFDTATKKIVTALKDETGREVQSEKLLEITIDGRKVVSAGNQFGVGMKQK